MYRTILVPLDGSSSAEYALPWALSLAQQDSSTLHLVRVHVPPVPITIGSELSNDLVVDDALRKSEIKYLENLTKHLRAISTIPIQTAVLEGGLVADAIRDHAYSLKTDLMVMTSHGRGAFARFWLGSTADEVIRHSTIPTLLVRPQDDVAADLSVRPFVNKIVVPLDGSELAERMLEPAIAFAKVTGSSVALVLVLDAVEDIEALASRKIQAPGGWFPEATLQKATGYVEKIAHRLRGHSLEVHAEVIQHGSAAKAILEYAATHGNPVICLATHGRSGLKRLLLGSVADKLIRGASMPVLVFHPAEAK